MMKKVVLVLSLLLILLLILFSSCTHRNDLVGRWQSSDYSEELGGTVTMVYHFREDGKIFIESDESAESDFALPFGTYQVKGTRVIITNDGMDTEFVFSVENGVLTLYAGEEVHSTFVKIQHT